MSTLAAMIDRAVTLEGVARDAAGGAILLGEGATPVYLDGLGRWDGAVEGRRIRARGILRRSAGAEVGEGSELRHGLPGERFVLEAASWEVLG